MGDSDFFRALNEAVRGGSAGGAGGWGALRSGWDAVSFDAALDVGGCEKPRINGEHKIWGLTSGDDVFSQIGRLVAGSSLPAMNTRCVRTLGRVTRRAGAQRRSREEA